MKINCSCLGKRMKEHINTSNLQPDVKNSFLNIRTCGEISKFDAAKLIIECQGQTPAKSASLECIIPKIKGAGLDYDEIRDLLLSMREEGAIDMEVGTPLKMTKENEKDLIIDSGKNRFAYAKINRIWADKMGLNFNDIIKVNRYNIEKSKGQ